MRTSIAAAAHSNETTRLSECCRRASSLLDGFCLLTVRASESKLTHELSALATLTTSHQRVAELAPPST